MISTVFGSLPFPSQNGEQLISKAVTTAIAALFKRTGKIAATVRAEPVAKLLQGSIDGFDLIGSGMVMYNGLRIDAMELYIQAVSIDFSAIFRGQITLKQPTQATMRVVLTEDDLTTSFNTPFVVEKLQKLQYQGETLHFQDTQMILHPDKSLQLKSNLRMGEREEAINLDVTAYLEVEDRRKIQFVDVSYNGDDEARELGKDLIDHVNNLLDLDKFALEGSQLRVDRLRVRDKQIIFYGVAQINRFPVRNPKGS